MTKRNKIILVCGIIMLIAAVIMFMFHGHKILRYCYGIGGILFIILSILPSKKS